MNQNTKTICQPTAPIELTAAKLQPRLHHHVWPQHCQLSDDGFSDSTVSINLSRHLKMSLSIGRTRLSYRGLAELGLSTRQAWDLSADNLIVAAQRPQGTRFYVRSARHETFIDASAIQIRVPGAPISAWLAHPRSFSILHKHVKLQIGAEPIYFVTDTDTLIVVPDNSPLVSQFCDWASDSISSNPKIDTEPIFDKPLTYRHGFPAAISVAHEGVLPLVA